ncbi:Uncharacterised protein [Mycobacteroides abscessus subsp. abscessus]|nr:Uncharacterised protein [Mycobacteroides abscessus subsp. abscessus]
MPYDAPFPSMLFLYNCRRGAPGTLATWRAAASITRSPALSQITASSGSVTSGAEYSGWAWST